MCWHRSWLNSSTGRYSMLPIVFKYAYITPLLKKPDLDPAENTGKHWPISNLSVLSKTLERLIARQLLDYLYAVNLMPDLQSVYRAIIRRKQQF